MYFYVILDQFQISFKFYSISFTKMEPVFLSKLVRLISFNCLINSTQIKHQSMEDENWPKRISFRRSWQFKWTKKNHLKLYRRKFCNLESKHLYVAISWFNSMKLCIERAWCRIWLDKNCVESTVNIYIDTTQRRTCKIQWSFKHWSATSSKVIGSKWACFVQN